jgi:hypothetical protein
MGAPVRNMLLVGICGLCAQLALAQSNTTGGAPSSSAAAAAPAQEAPTVASADEPKPPKSADIDKRCKKLAKQKGLKGDDATKFQKECLAAMTPQGT